MLLKVCAETVSSVESNFKVFKVRSAYYQYRRAHSCC